MPVVEPELPVDAAAVVVLVPVGSAVPPPWGPASSLPQAARARPPIRIQEVRIRIIGPRMPQLWTAVPRSQRRRGLPWQAAAVSHATAALSLALMLAGLGACKTSTGAVAGPEAAAIPPPSPTAPLQLAEADALDDHDDEPESRTAEAAELAAMTLPSRPDWMDKYAGQAPDERFFDIAALMEAHGLDRARAVELQNHFRDLTRAQPQGD